MKAEPPTATRKRDNSCLPVCIYGEVNAQKQTARRILYVGPLDSGSTCLYRMENLRQMGHTLIPFNTVPYNRHSRLLTALRLRYPFGPLIQQENHDLLATALRENPEVIWLDKPTHFTVETVQKLKLSGAFLVCFNMDNPFVGGAACKRWEFYQYRRVLSHMDLHCVFRTTDLPRYLALGCPFVKLTFSFAPQHHFPPPPDWTDAERSREVSYVGSPHDQRAEFLRILAYEKKIPLTISGPRWQKFLRPFEMRRLVRGGALMDADYRQAIWRSKINLSFVTHMNQDDVAHKAFEIAACGGFLLALRTPGHQASFEEGKEAEFFSSLEECAEKCRYYLQHPKERQAIALRGRERAWTSGYDNVTQLQSVFERIPQFQETSQERILARTEVLSGNAR